MTVYVATLWWLLAAFLTVVAATLFLMAVSSWRRPRPKPPRPGVWQAAALLLPKRGAITVVDRTHPGLHRAGQRWGRHSWRYLRLSTGPR